MKADAIAALAEQVIAGSPITRDQAESLIALKEKNLLALFLAASKIREHFIGPKVSCCSIVAAQVGRCSQDCAFCSQSAHYKTPVETPTTLAEDDILKAADSAKSNGAQSFGIVTSGHGPSDEQIEQWGNTISKIRSAGAVRPCVSLGVVSAHQAKRLAELGVQHYNLNLQTSRRHYPNIVTTHSYDERLEALINLKAAGISLCSGALFGMGETWADRLDLAFELRELDVDVVPINFLIPIEGTPLSERKLLPPMECLKIIAIYRFLLPQKRIKVAGGREVCLRDLQSWIFFAGADSFLIGNYLTTCGRSPEQDHQMIRDLGLELEAFDQQTPSTVTTQQPATCLQNAT